MCTTVPALISHAVNDKIRDFRHTDITTTVNEKEALLLLLPQYEEVKGVGVGVLRRDKNKVGVSQRDKNNAKYKRMYYRRYGTALQ
mmetsp:Transcript_65095/g.72701  ORF Transcript_65095/g.72701 Transcript_65095/m.72701 type:complete len:86 (-) Transcript_65095:33-290(-)